MDEWSWFHSSYNEPKKETYIDYRTIARSREKTLELLKINPNILFNVVGEYSNCMCGGTCGSCEYEDQYFIDLLLEYKTVTEKDLIDINELNWFKICSYVPLHRFPRIMGHPKFLETGVMKLDFIKIKTT